MKRLVLLAIGIVVLIIIGISVFALLHTTPSSQAPVNVQFPSGANSTSSQSTPIALMTVAAQDGGSITVRDFIHDGVTAADPQNKGVFYLAGSPGYCLQDGTCPSGASSDSYVVTYNNSNQSFTIELTNEPLSDARKRAEVFMEKTLGLSAAQLCSLKYYLSTTNAVNELYAGKNLGFSACTNAVELP